MHAVSTSWFGLHVAGRPTITFVVQCKNCLIQELKCEGTIMRTDMQQNPNVEVATEVDPERIAFEAAQREGATARHERPIQLSAKELVFGLTLLILWFGLFSGGILVSSKPYRDQLEFPQSLGLSAIITNWLIVTTTWSITNLGLLACIAASLGALGLRTRFTSRTDPMQAALEVAQPEDRGVATYYVSAIMRGFGIYGLVLAGLLVLATESLANPTQEAYMRLAPTVSIISFYAGYDPSIFAGLLDRVKSFLQSNNPKGT